ncbi:helix-turn-helix domain-containing protein [Chitinophagaceae bacterium LB-8]|uniref:Helix-turn-helix domain-containing protein n=1 Tax=Paraflavisolibacter caeni TaxID=2982496 RepID=A0A9X3BHV1_9BACT|nr:helix-turn-helix transcriptional regulator [Paraflavisolibacter caeni]MCU7549218.1 helix-turn-helix domain-containing protein [Paraflavisolibacter caeni]
MHLGKTIKKIREPKGLLQKQVAAQLGISQTTNNKLKNEGGEPSVKELQKLATLFNMTVHQILNYEGEVPGEVAIENKPGFEHLKLLNQLDEEDKQTVFKIIDTMLTKKKLKDFF